MTKAKNIIEKGGGAYTPWDCQSKRVYDVDGASPSINSGTKEGKNIQPIVLLKKKKGKENG